MDVDEDQEPSAGPSRDFYDDTTDEEYPELDLDRLAEEVSERQQAQIVRSAITRVRFWPDQTIPQLAIRQENETEGHRERESAEPEPEGAIASEDQEELEEWDHSSESDSDEGFASYVDQQVERALAELEWENTELDPIQADHESEAGNEDL